MWGKSFESNIIMVCSIKDNHTELSNNKTDLVKDKLFYRIDFFVALVDVMIDTV